MRIFRAFFGTQKLDNQALDDYNIKRRNVRFMHFLRDPIVLSQQARSCSHGIKRVAPFVQARLVSQDKAAGVGLGSRAENYL